MNIAGEMEGGWIKEIFISKVKSTGLVGQSDLDKAEAFRSLQFRISYLG